MYQIMVTGQIKGQMYHGADLGADTQLHIRINDLGYGFLGISAIVLVCFLQYYLNLFEFMRFSHSPAVARFGLDPQLVSSPEALLELLTRHYHLLSQQHYEVGFFLLLSLSAQDINIKMGTYIW
ncbi:hypothetical protein KC19_1G325200 [Ceratodon purpureus]|uniref:Uncharacterized protein n=1 Tax=Ceratodon purpureus TaxID=3225 RepID=A0A8T0JBT7_CERPU|nr:hypothetical protein KC19_1G325200 [Ceratodon purpureus]